MAPPKRPIAERLLEKRAIVGDCWEWTGSYTRDGYGVMNKGRRQFRVHRVAFEEFNGESADGAFVCHQCDNPKCFNPKHLFLGTPKDNNLDMKIKGRIVNVCGEDHKHAKLMAAQVTEIRQRRIENGETLNSIAADFGITFQTVSDIARGRRWKHM